MGTILAAAETSRILQGLFKVSLVIFAFGAAILLSNKLGGMIDKLRKKRKGNPPGSDAIKPEAGEAAERKEGAAEEGGQETAIGKEEKPEDPQ